MRPTHTHWRYIHSFISFYINYINLGAGKMKDVTFLTLSPGTKKGGSER